MFEPGEDPIGEAAAGLRGAMAQTLRNDVQAQNAQANAKVLGISEQNVHAAGQRGKQNQRQR